MKDSVGKGVVRLGDMTSHGGQVISADTNYTVLGKPVALDGDMTICPKCKGKFPIRAAHGDRLHHGKPVAYDGDVTACGAKLISSI